MKYLITLIFLFFGLLTIKSQTASEITNIQTPDLDENSGLIFYNNNIITFNDSGGEANLYEINASTGNITRTVTITNATNVDWEDITQDASYIYIGDIGNNNGNRTDLKIYKIAKNDYNGSDDIAVAEIISYSYADQLDFNSNPNNTNWDAEGLISYGEQLLIFSKNWVDNRVNVYSIPKTNGTYSALLESSYNTNGLITSAEISLNENIIYLIGYSNSQAPFMYTIHGIPNNSLDIFSGIISEKISNIVPLGNQVEAIALFEITPNQHRLYISNEKFIFSYEDITIIFPPKLWLIEIDAETITLDVLDITSDLTFTIFPNPLDKTLNLSEKVDEIIIFDLLGSIVTKQQYVKKISIENLNPGHYIAHIKINNSILIKQLIKK
ncbi:MAG: T9SS type A sorting domain-containing protein [Flavobacteriales bacterium]